jgi:ABC-2 type transport system ATP-binding protein
MVSTPQRRPVTTSALTKDYGSGAGVFEFDLEIDTGTILGLIGPSGSGKTTAVRLMTGVMAPDSGRVEVLGQAPIEFSPDTRARIGYMPQEALLYPELTLAENLNFTASLYGMPYKRQERLDLLVDFVELEGAIDRLPREASGGEKRRAMLAATLIHSPDLIFLDEPTAGIDPVLRRKFWDRFRELAEDGKTLIVTTQYVGEAAYCDYVAVLADGRILTVETPEGLQRAAYGGEVVEVDFESSPDAQQVQWLKDLAGDGLDWVATGTVRLVVDDAEEATTQISRWASDQDVELRKVERYQPPFDDVFVELVDRYNHDRDRERSAAR